MTKFEIKSSIYGQGSFGLTKINCQTGERIGHCIRVWTAYIGGHVIGRYLTRAEARDALNGIKCGAQEQN